ncbi:YceI family protein [Gramella sp. AN32]|uniref:YceI family protein n=1 Tax=Christiangramia antarctica TaxID=2058158 RepID=A0ABW5XBL0_9FLAO|nr:YceI family protein [Gramella sp. AN32]MCM4157336.1 YceI family protein [Gramella sp. AN32]
MKTYAKLKFLITVFLLGTVLNFNLQAQTYKLDNKSTQVIIEGTSNIHDWELKAEKCSGTLSVKTDDGKLEEIENLQFSVVAESLKSGKSGMDKNTYKALNTSEHKNISFKLDKVNSIEASSGDTYAVKSSGTLEVAGVKKTINLKFKIKMREDSAILTGRYKLDMTHYKIEPPTAVFGTITTGEIVIIKFETHFNK